MQIAIVSLTQPLREYMGCAYTLMKGGFAEEARMAIDRYSSCGFIERVTALEGVCCNDFIHV